MSERKTKDTSSQLPKQPMSHKEIVAGVKKVIAHKFTERDLIELRSYTNGLLNVAGRKKRN